MFAVFIGKSYVKDVTAWNVVLNYSLNYSSDCLSFVNFVLRRREGSEIKESFKQNFLPVKLPFSLFLRSSDLLSRRERLDEPAARAIFMARDTTRTAYLIAVSGRPNFTTMQPSRWRARGRVQTRRK